MLDRSQSTSCTLTKASTGIRTQALTGLPARAQATNFPSRSRDQKSAQAACVDCFNSVRVAPTGGRPAALQAAIAVWYAASLAGDVNSSKASRRDRSPRGGSLSEVVLLKV